MKPSTERAERRPLFCCAWWNLGSVMSPRLSDQRGLSAPLTHLWSTFKLRLPHHFSSRRSHPEETSLLIPRLPFYCFFFPLSRSHDFKLLSFSSHNNITLLLTITLAVTIPMYLYTSLFPFHASFLSLGVTMLYLPVLLSLSLSVHQCLLSGSLFVSFSFLFYG